jgi:hypothetical protein
MAIWTLREGQMEAALWTASAYLNSDQQQTAKKMFSS